MTFYSITKENLLFPEQVIMAKFYVSEKVVCNGFAGKGMALISVDKILNLYYTYLFSGSSSWNIPSCRIQLLFIFFPSPEFPVRAGWVAAAALVQYEPSACRADCFAVFGG